MPNRPTKIIVHHTASLSNGNSQINGVNENHRQRFNFKSSLGFYIGYHYLIEPSGEVRQCRLDTEDGAHTIGHNRSSLGICLSGDFDRQMPTQAQIDSLTDLLQKKTAEHKIPLSQIFPHRKFADKSCYGKNLPDAWAANLLRGYLTSKIAILMALIAKLQKSLKGRES